MSLVPFIVHHKIAEVTWRPLPAPWFSLLYGCFLLSTELVTSSGSLQVQMIPSALPNPKCSVPPPLTALGALGVLSDQGAGFQRAPFVAPHSPLPYGHDCVGDHVVKITPNGNCYLIIIFRTQICQYLLWTAMVIYNFTCPLSTSRAVKLERIKSVPSTITLEVSTLARHIERPDSAAGALLVIHLDERRRAFCTQAKALQCQCGRPALLLCSRRPPGHVPQCPCSSHSGHQFELYCPGLR